ncbi:MAG: cobalt-precorrin-5B (C(1))-methyltransferase CbiD [Thermodesulfobacteriota bacterium]
MTRLREGFTTGTAAAAAAKAGVLLLAAGEGRGVVDVPLPAGGRLAIPIARCEAEGEGVRVTVVKDAGDDPDVTHRAEIQALVALDPGLGDGEIVLDGGKGVGRATLPGLPVPPGEPAINPAPRAQIAAACREALEEAGRGGGARVLVEVPEGERLALKTLNPRLGILGGISILGARGTVKPFSHASYLATIEAGLDVARAAGLTHAILSTGGRSERLAREDLPGAPALACVQFADFFAPALAAAAARGFTRITVAVFFGKLAKQAQGLANTHARTAPLRLDFLAGTCAAAGLPPGDAARVAAANTAMEAQEIILASPARDACLAAVAAQALAAARGFAGPGPVLEYRLYTQDGKRLLVRTEEPASP